MRFSFREWSFQKCFVFVGEEPESEAVKNIFVLGARAGKQIPQRAAYFRQNVAIFCRERNDITSITRATAANSLRRNGKNVDLSLDKFSRSPPLEADRPPGTGGSESG